MNFLIEPFKSIQSFFFIFTNLFKFASEVQFEFHFYF